MRISIIKEDQAYSPNARAFNVFLDDVKQTDVLTADEENGFVFRLKRTKFGNLMVNRQGKKMTETAKGVVRIELKELADVEK
jgi:hypothetical protein